MSPPGTITDYLCALRGDLRLPARRRRRVMREVADHLEEAALDLHGKGLDPLAAECEAIRRFGPPGPLAARLSDELAASEAHRAAAFSLLLALAATACASVSVGRETFPAGLVEFVLFQVAVVVAGVTLVRSLRSRGAPTIPAPRLRLIARGTVVVTVCAGGCVLVAVLHEGRLTKVAGVLALLGVSILLVAAGHAARAAGRGVPAQSPRGEETIFDDLLDLLGRVLPGRSEVPRIPLDPRSRPWSFALAVSVLAGIAWAIAHGVGEGPPDMGQLPRVLLAGGLIASIEAVCSLAGYLLLGRFLAIRPDQRSELPASRTSAT